MTLQLFFNGNDYVVAHNDCQAQEILTSKYVNIEWFSSWKKIPPQDYLILIQNNHQIRQRVCKWVKENGKGWLAAINSNFSYIKSDFWKRN